MVRGGTPAWMINTLSLLFSVLAVGLVVVRASMLDRTLPWFKPVLPEMLHFRKKRPKGAPVPGARR